MEIECLYLVKFLFPNGIVNIGTSSTSSDTVESPVVYELDTSTIM